MQGAIIKTMDAGKSWIVPLVTHPKGAFFQALLSDPRNASHLWAAAGYDFMGTWDAGETWEPIEESVIDSTAVIYDMIWDQVNETIYVGTGKGVYSWKP